MDKLAAPLALAFAIAGAAPAGAFASVEIGLYSSIYVSDGLLGCTDTSAACTQTQQDETYGNVNMVPSGGRVLTGFSFRDVSGTVQLVTLRRSGSDIIRVGNAQNLTPGPGYRAYTAHIPVSPGDFIGLQLGPGARIGVLDGGSSANAFELGVSNPLSTINATEPFELQLGARIEEDRDNDGRGDDTEDPDRGSPAPVTPDGGSPAPVTPDPLAELRAGKRPGARILGKSYKASKKWIVKITAKNPNGYKLKGKLTLKSGKAKFGSKSVSIAAKSNKTLRIRLSRRARSRLKRKRRLKVTAIVKVRGPIGKSRTVKKRVVLRAPAKPKPKRGGGGGGGGDGGCTTTTYNPVTQQVEVVYKVPCPY